MADEIQLRPGSATSVSTAGGSQINIRVDAASSASSRWLSRIGWSLLAVSLALNAGYYFVPPGYVRPALHEEHVAGADGAADRIAVINFEGTISPPFTERWLRQLDEATKDDSIKGVVLAIDSPGGFVADSHQLYRRIQSLVKVKPVAVSMKRLAASGGYYIAMGIGEKGRIYAEPTTWTGSIGVIIPRYDATELVEKIGVKMEPLVTGPLKDTLSPFRNMTDQEHQVWDAIIQDSFDRFIGVIADNRSELDGAAVRQLATGQIYTASQAVANHLVDEIGYVEDACARLASDMKLTSWEAFEYRATPGVVDYLIGAAADSPSVTEQLLEAGVPKAMYYASWNPLLPTMSAQP